MTVATTARKQQFTLDGVTAAFTFTFRALPSSPTDIKCTKTSSGTDTALVYTTDFTVSVIANGVGGTVTLVSPSAVGSGTLTVYRDTTNTQASDYDNYNQFPANTLETDLDIRTLISQEQKETLDRALTLSITSSGVSATLPSPTADAVLGWNSGATALENKTLGSLGATALASQAEAVAGTNNTTYTSPLRVFQGAAALLAALTAAVNFAKGTDIASASTTNIASATGNFVDVTGTVTITALGTAQAGTHRWVRFTGALILTHNASSLILPTGANITTVAGDTALFVSLGSGNWVCVNYQRKSGAALVGTSPSFKQFAFTRDVSTASGSQSVTGVGFQPSLIILWGNVDSGPFCLGAYDGTSQKGTIFRSTGTLWFSNGSFILGFQFNSTPDQSYAAAASMDSDGFTLTWTKNNSPTGTANIYGVAFK